MTTRIVVTGSRKWRDKRALLEALTEVISTRSWPITIVTGGQVSQDRKTGELYGADYLMGELARGVGIPVEEHKVTPEEWETVGRKAGPLRNRKMISTLTPGTDDCCLAFPWGESRGTRGCMAMAEEAKIPVIDKGRS